MTNERKIYMYIQLVYYILKYIEQMSKKTNKFYWIMEIKFDSKLLFVHIIRWDKYKNYGEEKVNIYNHNK